MSGGPDLANLPELYVPYAEVRGAAAQKAASACRAHEASARRSGDDPRVPRRVGAHRGEPSGFLPMKARNRDMTVDRRRARLATSSGSFRSTRGDGRCVTCGLRVLAAVALAIGPARRSRGRCPAPVPVPAADPPPAIGAPAYLLLDLTSGQAIARRECRRAARARVADEADDGVPRRSRRCATRRSRRRRWCRFRRRHGTPKARGCSSSRARRSPSTSCCAG